jgi:hypothetical protein
MTEDNSPENRRDLDLPIGTKEISKLNPARVKIIRVEWKSVGKDVAKKVEKLVCFVQHPDRTDALVELSNVKYISNDKIVTSGLFKNLDDDGKLRKNSAVAQFLNFMNAKTPKELEGLSVEAVSDGSAQAYLVMKSYN